MKLFGTSTRLDLDLVLVEKRVELCEADTKITSHPANDPENGYKCSIMYESESVYWLMVNTFRQTPLEGIYSHKKGPKIAITYQSNPASLHTPSHI